MKKLNMKSIASMFVVVLMIIGVNSYAQRGQGNGYGPGNGQCYAMQNGNSTGSFCQNLPNLTEEQQNKISALRTTHLKDMQNSRNLLEEKRARLQTLRTAEQADMSSINKTIDEISVLNSEMQKNREKHIQDVRALLNDEQKVIFDQHKGNSYGSGCGQGVGRRAGNGSGRCGKSCRRN